MSFFGLPNWLKPHLFTGKNFDDLTAEELGSIQRRVKKFTEDEPVVSVVIPAWNEANNIYRTVSALAASSTQLKVKSL